MSKTKLPSEWTTIVRFEHLPALHPVRMAADHQIGAGGGERAGATRWLGSGSCVYWVPQWVITTTDPPRPSVLMSRLTRRRAPGRAGRSAAACPSGSSRPGRLAAGRLADGVGAEEADADPVALDDRPAAVPRRACARLPPPRCPCANRSEGRTQRSRPPSRRRGCWPATRDRSRPVAEPRRPRGRRRTSPPPWVGVAVPRQGRLEVADGDLRRRQPLGQRPQRSGGVVLGRHLRADPTGQHDVAHGGQRRHLRQGLFDFAQAGDSSSGAATGAGRPRSAPGPSRRRRRPGSRRGCRCARAPGAIARPASRSGW